MQRNPISIHGGGIAGLSAAQILTRLGHSVVISAAGQPSPRSVALNGASLFLLERIWGRDLLAVSTGHRLERRRLVWGGMEPAILDEPVVVDDVARLVERMTCALERDSLIEWDTAGTHGGPDIVAAKLDGVECYLSGGTRQAVQAQARLTDEADAQSMHVEAVASGWLVISPVGGGNATLMGVALDENVCLNTLLDESKYARAAIAQLGPSSAPSNAAPRLFVSAQFAASAIRIGDCAMRFDPISGDGVAGALRGAHLAVLLLERRCNGAESADSHAIYEQRLARAMRAHLGALARLYQDAPLAKSWAHELRAMQAMDQAIGKAWPSEETRVVIMEDSLAAI